MDRFTKIYGKYNKLNNWKISVSNLIYDLIYQNLEILDDNISLDRLLYLVSKMEYKCAIKSKEINHLGFVPFPQKELFNYTRDYPQMIDFLINIGALSKRNYSVASKRCNMYKFNYNSLYKNGNTIFYLKDVNLTEKALVRKNIEPRIECDKKSYHLLKWIKNGLEFDLQAFNIDEKSEFIYNKYSSKEYATFYSTIINYKNAIQSIINKQIRFTRDASKDNRVHTTLTNFPSKLRTYLKYDDEILCSLDIKNSQPYFLLIFLNKTNLKESRIIKILNKIYGNNSIMSTKISVTMMNKGFNEELKRFSNIVLNGKFYEELTDICKIEPNKDGKYKLKVYNKSSDKVRFVELNNNRDYAKRLALKILFSSNSRITKDYHEFRNQFPLISQIIETLKPLGCYEKFAKLLQHIEADCVIDYLTLKLSKKHPEMPLFTIHDSIVTTEKWFDLLQFEVDILMDEYSDGLKPILKPEKWCKAA